MAQSWGGGRFPTSLWKLAPPCQSMDWELSEHLHTAPHLDSSRCSGPLGAEGAGLEEHGACDDRLMSGLLCAISLGNNSIITNNNILKHFESSEMGDLTDLMPPEL